MVNGRPSPVTPRRAARPIGMLAAIAAIALLIWLLAGIQRGGDPSPYALTEFRKGGQLPPSAWANPEGCGKCHAAEYAAWVRSNHARANRTVDPTTDSDRFTGSFSTGPERFSTSIKGGEFFLAATGTALGEVSFPVRGAIGVEPLQQYLAAVGRGRYQATPIAWDVNAKEWFHVFENEPRAPYTWGHWLGQGMNWNSNCASCHMTDYQKNYDPAQDAYRSTWRHHGLTCIQCHSGAEDHARLATAGGASLPALRLDPSVRVEHCAACHSRREELTGAVFRAGENYHDHHCLALADAPGLYHDDGQIRDEVFEYGSFLMSRMGGKAGVTCLDCHDPHSLQTILPVENNALCMNCHGTGLRNAPIIEPTAHSHHAEGSTGNRCVSCHMPTTVYMARDPRHDHAFLSPDPRLTEELGIPNACNRCHADQSAGWARDAAETWYGPDMNAATRARAHAMARARAAAQDGLANILARLAVEDVPAWRANLTGMLEPYLGDPRAVSAAAAGIRDESPLVRDRAARVLAAHPRAGELLAPLETDPLRSVRIAYARARKESLDSVSLPMRDLLALFEANSDRPAQLLEAAELDASRGTPDDVRDKVRRALTLDKDSLPTLLDAAVILARIGDLDPARELLVRAAALAPDSPEPHWSIGLLEAERGDLPAAVAALRRCVELDPHRGRAWFNLALALTKTDRWEEALPAIERAIERMPPSKETVYTKAVILRKLGRSDEAETLLEQLRR